MSGKYALIIGNTEYIDPGLAQLTAPGKDAEDFARVLKDKELCGFDAVKVLLDQLSSSVIEAIDEFFDQKKPDDMLVLYFSGHGVRDEIGSLYLAFTNTIRTRLRSTAIKADYIREAMDQSRSKRQVLVLDCCNSGAFPQGTKAEVGGVMGLTQAFQGYGRFVLTASDATQFAWEGNKVIGETDNSLFTHFLVKGLEGEADSDSDGKITVDELYDYAYEQISKVTPKQTPTKSAAKVEGEIVLRQIARIEDIKPVSLPDELIEATEDSRTFVREGAVQQLEKLLKGKNLGLVRSARETLERIEREDDSRRVSQAATQVLEPIRQAEKAEEERKAREEADRIAAQKAEEERMELEKAEVERLFAEQKAEEERKAKNEAKRLAALKAKEERIAQEEAERLALQKAEQERLAREKAETERKAKEAKRLARAKVEREAAEKATREKADAKHKADQESERQAKQKVREGSVTRSTLAQQSETDKIMLRPRWISVLWITLGWTIGITVGIGIGRQFFNWPLAFAIGGAINGITTAIVLRIEHTVTNWKSMLWIILTGAISFSIGFAIGVTRVVGPNYTTSFAIGGILGGSINGFVMAIILRSEYAVFAWRSTFWIAFFGAIGLALSWGIGNFLLESGFTSMPISFAIGGLIGGIISAYAMIQQTRKEINSNLQI